MTHTNRAPRTIFAAALAAAALAIAGCGGGDDYENKPRPPQPIVVTAAITPKSVSVSPKEFGAGPISLVVTNLTPATQQVTLETAGRAAGIRQSTGPINPRETASLKADLSQGEYEVHVASEDVKPAKITVGPSRPSAQNDLLQP